MIKQLALAIAVQSFASAAPQEQSREMAEKQKLMQPGVQHAQLDRMAGSWTVAVTFKAGSGAEYQSTATSEAKWILGGRFLQQQYKKLRTITTIVDHDHYIVEWYLTGPAGPEEKIAGRRQNRLRHCSRRFRLPASLSATSQVHGE
jgi:hypothetical protein